MVSFERKVFPRFALYLGMYEYIEKSCNYAEEIEISSCSREKNSSIGQWYLKIIQKIKIVGYVKIK